MFFGSSTSYPSRSSAATCPRNCACTSWNALVVAGPRVPPNTGNGAVGANCSRASATSSRSRLRCTNASDCAKMAAGSKDQGRGEVRATAAAVRSYDDRHASPAAMASRRLSVARATWPSNRSDSTTVARQRAITSVDTRRSSAMRRSGVL